MSNGGNMLQNAQDGIGHAVRGGMNALSSMNPMQQAGAVGGVTAGIGGGAALANDIRKGGQAVADVAEEAAPLANGLRQKAGAMLKNPYALGAGGLALAGGAGGAYAMNRPEDQM
jgi:hypothetical protein